MKKLSKNYVSQKDNVQAFVTCYCSPSVWCNCTDSNPTLQYSRWKASFDNLSKVEYKAYWG